MEVFYGGDGVHVAQSLLSYDHEDEEGEGEEPRIAGAESVPEKINEVKKGIMFYPNPASSEVFVIFTDKFLSRQRMQIFNSLNQLCAEYILPEGISRFRFSVAALQGGIYNCRVITDKKISEIVKLLIIK